MIPCGNIVQTIADIGALVRAERRARGMTQADFAMLVGVGRRFIIDLEAGKPTIEAGKMLGVLAQIGQITRIGRE